MLKFVLIIVLGYYFLKLLFRAMMPFLLKYIIKKAEGKQTLFLKGFRVWGPYSVLAVFFFIWLA
ncbi:MAG: hypothetical protein COB85_07130, partial [Bacteroidetes bacterium]